MDLEPMAYESQPGAAQTYATFDDLYSYCYLVASVVGLVCIRVFGYTDRSAVNRVMRRVCKRAGIEARATHAAGRHSFATNALAAGADIKDAMEAGGWKSSKLFMDTYVHARQGARRVAALFDAQTGPVDLLKATSIKERRATFGKLK